MKEPLILQNRSVLMRASIPMVILTIPVHPRFHSLPAVTLSSPHSQVLSVSGTLLKRLLLQHTLLLRHEEQHPQPALGCFSE